MSEDGSQIKEGLFNNAIISLQQLKTTFSPMEKLFVIHSTFQEITKVCFIFNTNILFILLEIDLFH